MKNKNRLNRYQTNKLKVVNKICIIGLKTKNNKNSCNEYYDIDPIKWTNTLPKKKKLQKIKKQI